MGTARYILAIPFSVLAVPAFAAGLVEPAPIIEPTPVIPAAPAFDFSGPSVGLRLGYGDVETEDPDLEGDGVVGGVALNYDYDFGGFIAGGTINYDAADIELTPDGSDDEVATLDGVLRVGARAGFNSGRNWYYATGGWARAYTDSDDDFVGDSDGYFVGLGYEVFLTQNVTAGAEALYHEFDDFDVEDLDAEATTVTLSVNYRF